MRSGCPVLVAFFATGRGFSGWWPILSFALFAKFRVGMFEAGAQPATDCEAGRYRVEMGRHAAAETLYPSVELPHSSQKEGLNGPPAYLMRRTNVREIAADARITDRASAIREFYNVRGNKIRTPDAFTLRLRLFTKPTNF